MRRQNNERMNEKNDDLQLGVAARVTRFYCFWLGGRERCEGLVELADGVEEWCGQGKGSDDDDGGKVVAGGCMPLMVAGRLYCAGCRRERERCRWEDSTTVWPETSDA